VCWLLLCICRPVMIFEGCLKTQSTAVASGRATNLATHLQKLAKLVMPAAWYSKVDLECKY
jgi:hypothetical protein